MERGTSLLDEPAGTPWGNAAVAILDGIITIIMGLYDISCKNTIGNLNSITSGAIVIAMGIFLLLTGYLLLKEKKSGYYLALIMAVVTLLYGAAIIFAVQNTMTFKIYFLLTGILMLVYLVSPKARAGLS